MVPYRISFDLCSLLVSVIWDLGLGLGLGLGLWQFDGIDFLQNVITNVGFRILTGKWKSLLFLWEVK